MSTWEQETSESLIANLTALGAVERDVESTTTDVGQRVVLSDGEGKATINVDLVEGQMASVEVKAVQPWLKDFDTTTESQRRAVRALLERWFSAVFTGNVVVRVHRVAGLTIGSDLLLGGELALVSGASPLKVVATSHTETTFAAYDSGGGTPESPTT